MERSSILDRAITDKFGSRSFLVSEAKKKKF